MILQILHINSIVSPLMDSKLFFKRFVLQKFFPLYAVLLFSFTFFRSKSAFNAAKYCEITNFLVSPFALLRFARPKKDKNMC